MLTMVLLMKLNLTILLMLFSINVMAYGFGGYGNDFDYGYNNDESSEGNYESMTGNKYQYDLSRPTDRLLYDVDPAAKIRDDINPMIEIDRGLGQYGGGIYFD